MVVVLKFNVTLLQLTWAKKYFAQVILKTPNLKFVQTKSILIRYTNFLTLFLSLENIFVIKFCPENLNYNLQIFLGTCFGYFGLVWASVNMTFGHIGIVATFNQLSSPSSLFCEVKLFLSNSKQFQILMSLIISKQP